LVILVLRDKLRAVNGLMVTLYREQFYTGFTSALGLLNCSKHVNVWLDIPEISFNYVVMVTAEYEGRFRNVFYILRSYGFYYARLHEKSGC